MTTSKPTKYTVTLPGGESGSLTLSSELDPKLVELALRLFIGSFAAVAKATSTQDQRDFLIRFVASTANTADTAIRSAQMANKMHNSNKKVIIEDLLKSLH